MAPSTFASAAASSKENSTPTRDGGADWARRTNGATHTFRRTSNAPATSAATPQTDATAATHSQPPRYVPPHRNGATPDARYSKGQLLDLYRTQQGATDGQDELQELFIGGWQPHASNGAPPTSWGRNDHSRDPPPGPDACWEKQGFAEPLGMTDLDDEERELFTSSVNTPLKPPTQNKDNQQANGVPGRKISISLGANSPGGFGAPSPSTARMSGRRRETSESYPFPDSLASPTGGFNRDQQRAASPPPSLLRRRTDLKDLNKIEDRDNSSEEKPATTPFGTLKRQNTGPLNTAFGTPGSPWTNTPQSAGFSPMGSFGNFGLGGTGSQQATPTAKGPGLGSGRAESRFKNVLQKDSSEDLGGKTLERKTSVSNLPKVNENESWRPMDRGDLVNAPLEEAEEDAPSGSAALSAGSDLSPPQNRQGPRGFDTPSRSGTRDEFGFGAFGMTSDNTGGFGHGFAHGREQQTPGQQRAGLGMGGNDPMSPTDTNPYKSPDQHGVDHTREHNDHEGHDMQHGPLPGLGGFGGDHMQQHGGLGGLSALPNLGRGIAPQGPASDRSQTSSTGPGRAFPGLGGLGSLGGMPGASAWPPGQGALGTPGRQPNAFGAGLFGNPMGDLQSPSLAGLGAGGGFGGSRMSSMFPQGMQDQLRQPEVGGERLDQGPFGGLGSLGGPGDGDSAFQGQMLSSLLAEGDSDGKLGGLLDPLLAAQGAPQPPGSSASNQPPAPQQRTMVMPDRMRWIYRDPQGQTQGPWSGLEMHDWYKAGFFSPELLVKKAEDGEYEPLAQLIRRIGNSREPFLVPQIGIPHGAASAQGAWQPGIPPNPTSSAGAQPPFASSFPSFGTTLTADQQNALERRKQEEQYLMARQKEHLAQAQMTQRMTHVPGGFSGYGSGNGQGQLQHQSSVQSLHSQPSFGSISSPNAFQPSPSQGAAGQQPGFFDNSFRGAQGGLGAVGAGVDSLGHIREEEIPSIMDRLNLGNRALQGSQFGAPGQPFTQQPGQQQSQEQQVQQMLQDRARLAEEQAKHDALEQEQPGQQVPNDRLQQFQQLQNAVPGLDARFQAAAGPTAQQAAGQSSKAASSTTQSSSIGSPVVAHQEKTHAQESLSLTEQVQKAASAKQSPAPLPQVWAKVEAGIPMPFPPAPSQSPLPAPAAQRTGRQSVADHLHAESRSRSQTPSLDTPSTAVAPWAKEPAEASKGPSLKQIQEMEAKKAAETELLAVAARRAALQREMEAQALNVVVPAAPGLPSTANWAATGASPATPTSASAWAKAAQPKPAASGAKSMAQIQKEEEVRKRRVAAAAASAQASAVGAVPSPALGKSYANLASKVGAPAPPAVGGAWTTVGSGGKSKTPVAPVTAVVAPRVPSISAVPTLPQIAAKKIPSRQSTLTGSGAPNAEAEFKKWATAELRPDLAKGLNADEFFAILTSLPPDTDIITEAVHASSSTIDSRHFANEFIRRKKLADKGLVDSSAPPKTASPLNAGGAGTGGWSEVAKKGPVKEVAGKEDAAANANGAFRVVPAKKRGGKR